MTSKTLIELIGASNNLGEAPGILNHPANLLGIVITFMLSTSAGSISICCATIYGGLGQHFILLGLDGMVRYLKIFYVANATYPSSAGLIKLALLFQYLRVHETPRIFRKTNIAMVVIVSIWSLVYTILGWIPAWPVYAYWDFAAEGVRFGFGSDYVKPFVTIYVQLTSTNMILDVIVLALAAPPLLLNNSAGKSSRLSLLALFCLGSIATILSVCRLAAIVATHATTWPTFDPTWYGAMPIVLTALEVDIATIAASIPVFWPVLRSIDISQILITREVKVTLEDRQHMNTARTDSLVEDEDIELERSDSVSRLNRKKGEHYGDPYVREQVNPFKKYEYGTRTKIDVSRLGRHKGGASSVDASNAV
ncbi:hypothetical protein BD289DRAFT_478212 [Coniella lustricola]|uniref:Rhodopsin domain-containing protein n=1 Tax=Coniella lustricola TaxID=2025994 RepID=A0A2T3ANX2_9PEZI|nr:hypothetical protein BD289DRAFT_478212 [Coniella lustricola]